MTGSPHSHARMHSANQPVKLAIGLAGTPLPQFANRPTAVCPPTGQQLRFVRTLHRHRRNSTKKDKHERARRSGPYKDNRRRGLGRINSSIFGVGRGHKKSVIILPVAGPTDMKEWEEKEEEERHKWVCGQGQKFIWKEYEY